MLQAQEMLKLGGLLTIMPISFTITVITALSMAVFHRLMASFLKKIS